MEQVIFQSGFCSIFQKQM